MMNKDEQQYFDEFFEEIFTEVNDKYGEIEEMEVSSSEISPDFPVLS